MLLADSMLGWFDQGVAVAVLVFVGAVVAWIARRMFGKDGPVEKVAATHIKYVESANTMQKKLSERLVGHMETEEKHVDRVRRIGLHACDVMDDASAKLGLSEASHEALDAIRAELRAQPGD